MGHSHRQSVVPTLATDANISVDVDGLDCYRAIHGLSTPPGDPDADPVWTIGIARAAELFDAFDLEATFFVVGRDLDVDAHRRRAVDLVEAGHELANHTLDHPYDLRERSDAELAHQINGADRKIADATGYSPVGFRAPGYNVDADVIAFSRRAGHRYDASVFPCVSYWAAKAAVMQWRDVRGQPSRSHRTDPKNLAAPTQPYFPDAIDCWRAATSTTGYIEIPIAVMARTVPIIGTTLHLLDAVGFSRTWPLIDRSFPRFFNLEMHAIDFVDTSDLADLEDADELIARQPDLRIPWSVKRDRYRRVLAAICEDRNPATLAAATESVRNPGEHP